MKTMNRYHQYMYSYPHKTAYRPLSKEQVHAALRDFKQQNAGLYIHLPFCQTKCGYCNLFSVAAPEPALIDGYLKALSRQAAQITDIIPLTSVNFDSLIMGGGTPGLLDIQQLDKLFNIIQQTAAIAPENTPAMIELSPQAATIEKVEFLRQAGFKRVSLGIQSFHQDELKSLGRQEHPHAAKQALELLQGKFDTCNLDLIYGIPGQTKETLLDSIHIALSFQPDEIFLYPLYVRRDTPLEGEILNEAHTASLYYVGRDALLTDGYQQISMRRFVRQSSLHDNDCGMEQCLSLGCGGRSYLGNLHVCEPYSVRPAQCRKHLMEFINKQDFTTGLHGYLLDSEEQKRRYIIKNLLHIQGINIKTYQRHFDSTPEADFPVLMTLFQKNMIQYQNNTICLTEEGMAWSDGIGCLFISPQVMTLSKAFYQNK